MCLHVKGKKKNRQIKLTTNAEKYMADVTHILKSTCKNTINKEYLHIYKQKPKPPLLRLITKEILSLLIFPVRNR